MMEIEEAVPETSLRDVLTVLFKRRRIVVTFAVTVITVVTLGTFLMAPKYEARATILVKKARAEVPLVPKESSQLIISQLTEEDLNSEIEILKSRQLMEEVLETMGVDRHSIRAVQLASPGPVFFIQDRPRVDHRHASGRRPRGPDQL